VLVAVLALMQHARGLAARSNCLEVIRVRGTASTFRLVTDVPRSLVNGSTVGMGDTIRTGADTSVILRGTDGTILRIPSNTRLTITACSFDPGTRKRNRQVYLQKGRVVVRAAKQRPGSVLSIATPRARVSVVGTTFSVDTPNGKDTTVAVLEGVTQVVGALEQKSVQAGQEAGVTAGGEVEDPDKLSEEKRKQLEEALAELKKLEGRFAELEQGLTDLEEGVLVAGIEDLFKAVRKTGKGHEEEVPQAAAIAKATASMIAICSALETAACEEEGDYPQTLNLSTLEELGLPKENALMMLDSFKDEKLESYSRTGSSYAFTARAKDKDGTLLKATQGRVSREGGSGQSGSGDKEKQKDE